MILKFFKSSEKNKNSQTDLEEPINFTLREKRYQFNQKNRRGLPEIEVCKN